MTLARTAFIATLIGAVSAPALANEPALERVSNRELASPLLENLAVPPAELGGVEGFRRIYRDPRFPSVLLRREGALYIASRQMGPVPNSRSFSTLPSDTVYFLGRPDESMIAGVWPDAVVQPAARGTADADAGALAPAAPPSAPAQRPSAAEIEPAAAGHVSAPRMCRADVRERRLRQLAERALHMKNAASEPRR